MADFKGVKETTNPKVNFTNQDKQNLFRVEHSAPVNFFEYIHIEIGKYNLPCEMTGWSVCIS